MPRTRHIISVTVRADYPTTDPPVATIKKALRSCLSILGFTNTDIEVSSMPEKKDSSRT